MAPRLIDPENGLLDDLLLVGILIFLVLVAVLLLCGVVFVFYAVGKLIGALAALILAYAASITP